MSTTAVLTGTQWSVDPVHSEIAFKVKHLMITNVKGVFSKYQITVNSDKHHPISPDVHLTIDPSSISTGDAGRDQHLRTGDFFHVDQFPAIEFKGKSIDKIKNDDYQLHGDLTIKGITKPVTFDVEFGGIQRDPWGNEKAGVSVTGKINRSDFDLTFNAALETGGVMLGEEVKISADLELIKQQA
jgi:polyisoprenoid-binding protein YceI